MSGRTHFPLVCGLMLACVGAHLRVGATTAQDEVLEERLSDPPEVHYTIRAGDCTISWQVYLSEPNRGVIRHRYDCGLPLAEQASLIAKVLNKVLDGGAEPGQFRTLSWGRLFPDGARDATMAVRLALAAKRSADWDTRRGAPRSGDVNAFVRKLANDVLIYEELQRVFGSVGLELRFAAVEKVLVMRARDIPIWDRLREGGAQPGDKLPFDCQTWFSVATRQTDRSRPKGEKK